MRYNITNGIIAQMRKSMRSQCQNGKSSHPTEKNDPTKPVDSVSDTWRGHPVKTLCFCLLTQLLANIQSGYSPYNSSALFPFKTPGKGLTFPGI